MRRRTKRIFKRYVFGIAGIMFVVVFYALGIRSTVRESVLFNINSGDTVASVARRLDSKKIVFSDTAFHLQKKDGTDKYYMDVFHNFEIIGNIHEQKE